jgi:hypothetical protein
MARTTGRVKGLSYAVLLAVMLLLCLSCMNSQDIQEKMRVFYEYDEMFYPETPRTSLNIKTGERKEEYGFEVGGYDEITTVEGITPEYREKVSEYLDIMTGFIDANITYFEELYEMVMRKGFYPKDFITPIEGSENLYNACESLRERLRKQIFNEFEDIVRIQVSYDNLVAFELAKQIGDDEYATMLVHVDYECYTFVAWWLYYAHAQNTPGGTEYVKDGRMRFPYWFYESNLKLRIIKQIADEQNNYYGELSVDVYKLDKYDELFDKDGKPKY